MKKVFTTGWLVKGKTPYALYAEWQNSSFDPAKDYIEDFIGDVRQIATQLGYLEAAQAMAIKVNWPIKMYNTCLNIDGFNAFIEFLIKVFDNARLKKSYGQGTSKDTITGAFSMGTYIRDYATPISSADMSKLISGMDSLEASFQSLQCRGPYEPQAAPQRGRCFEKPYNR